MSETRSSSEDVVESVSEPETTAVGGLTPEMASVVAYLFSPITGLLVFLMEEDDEFVRFHGMQSILFGLIWVGIYILITIISTVTFGLGTILFLPALPIGFAMWAFLMYKASQGEEWAIPGLESFVRNQI